MNEERMAKAWELAAEICGRFDCDELNPPRSSEELKDLDAVIGEMCQQAKRLRAEGLTCGEINCQEVDPPQEETDQAIERAATTLCGHQCRTLRGLHTCTLPKGHPFCHQEYGELGVPKASWSEDQGHAANKQASDGGEA